MQRIFLIFISLMLVIPLSAQTQPGPQPTRDLMASPTAAPIISEDSTATTILLIGTGSEHSGTGPYLTDTLIIAVLLPDSGRAALLSIPRDLWVYIPDTGMAKINQATFFGARRGDEDGGIGLLKETLLYNLGIEVDHYARVDFSGFSSLVDSLGGIIVTVDCTIEDWKLKEQDLDKQDPNNWELVQLETGVHILDGDWSLWYARSRRTSSDLDRNRRQQDILRAIWRRLESQGFLADIPALWEQWQSYVDTDLDLGDLLSLLPTFVRIDPAAVGFYNFRLNREVRNGHSPDMGRAILVPDYERIRMLVEAAYSPVPASRIAGHVPTVAVVGSAGISRSMMRVAAERLERAGFHPEILEGDYEGPRQWNKLIDYTGMEKGNPANLIQDLMYITDEGVEKQPDPNRSYDYRLILGSSYNSNACTWPVRQPTPEPEDNTASAEG